MPRGTLCPIVDLCSLVIICLVHQLPCRTDGRCGMNVLISSVSVYRLRSSCCAVIREKHKDFSSVSFVYSVNNHPEAIVSLFRLFVCLRDGGSEGHSRCFFAAGSWLKCDFSLSPPLSVTTLWIKCMYRTGLWLSAEFSRFLLWQQNRKPDLSAHILSLPSINRHPVWSVAEKLPAVHFFSHKRAPCTGFISPHAPC